MSSLSFRSPQKSRTNIPPSSTPVTSSTLSLLTILRLMLPKLGVAYLFVMLLSVYNRIMIHELKIAATVVGLLYLIYNLMSIFQVSNGRLSDRRALFGLRRTPLIVFGLLIAALALIPLPYIAPLFAQGNPLAFLGMVLIMIVFGIGFAMNGDGQNTLIADLTEGKSNRPGTVSAVWMFQIICIVATAIIISIVLRSAELRAGIAASCVTPECIAGRSNIALSHMPTLFAIGPLIAIIGLLPLIGLEPRLTREQIQQAQQRPPLNIKQAYTRIFANAQTRVFFFFIFTAIFALFLQDDILEPFGADVFHLSASQTSSFQSMMGGMTIIAMLVTGIIASKRPIPKRNIVHVGALVTATGFALLAASTLVHALPVAYAGILVLGFGMGTFNIGALSMMMDMTIPGEAGTLMGAWGMSQALANGSAQFSGGAMRDGGLILFGNASSAYGFIFCTSVVLCIVALALMRQVNVEKFRRMTREQLGQTLAEA